MTLTHLCERGGSAPGAGVRVTHARAGGQAELTRRAGDNTVPSRHSYTDIESVHCDRRTIVRVILKSATAVALAALVSISAATTSQATQLTPLGGATGCCRAALQ